MKSVDIYAKPITMTYQGNQKFKSTFGGIISMLLISLIVAMFGYKMSLMINRGQTQVKKNTLVTASNSYSPPENLMDQNVTIAFMLSDWSWDGA